MRYRHAFTLVELLVVITILAILASLLMFALASAQEAAIEMRTRATIAKLNAVIMDKLESYRTRRLPVDIKAVAAYYQTLPAGDPRYIDPASAPMDASTLARVDAIRDLMRLEMPDSYRDLDDDAATEWQDAAGTLQRMTTPSVTRTYRSVLPAAASRSAKDISAKCLFLIVSKGSGDPDIMEQFAPYEIGADQADGTRYFVDGWGKPIYFLRWGPAYGLPPYVDPLQPQPPTQRDTFDPSNVFGRRTSPPAETTFPLFPLIYSAGSDGAYGIAVDPTPPAAPISYSQANNDPFAPAVVSFVGKQDAESIDNVTNHLIETR